MIRIKSHTSFSCSGLRPNQEDFIVSSDNSSRIFVLCDGMGGHGHGEVASKIVAESVFKYLTELNPVEYKPEHLQEALNFALSELVKADVYDDEKPMGTTLVVTAINRMNILVGHVGDSRCYQFSNEGIKKFRTKDHSKVQEAIDADILTEEEAWNNPNKNIITRCIMSKSSNVLLDINSLIIEDEDILLLCSDGVTDAMTDTQIQSYIIGRDIEDISLCIKNDCELSSKDNFSAILMSLSQDEENPKIVTLVEDKPFNGNTVDSGKTAYCPYCGRGMSKHASFCPQCGKMVGMKPSGCKNDSNRDNSKKSPMELISKINPIWSAIGGAAIGGFIGWLLSGACTTDEPHTTIPLRDNSTIDETKMTLFINTLCEIDTMAQPLDSILLKTDVMSQYQSFLDNLKNN